MIMGCLETARGGIIRTDLAHISSIYMTYAPSSDESCLFSEVDSVLYNQLKWLKSTSFLRIGDHGA